MRRLAAIVVLLFAFAAVAHGQALRFFAKPYEVFEGDAVVFNYLEADRAPGVPTVKLSQITSWKWDFDGNNTWDESHAVGDIDPNTGLPLTVAAINAIWYARITNGLTSQNFTPVLQVTYADGTGAHTLTQTGVSEDVFGTDGGTYPQGVDPSITVKSRASGDANLSVNFTLNPRLALTTDTVKLYAKVTPADGRTLSNLAYYWMFVNRSGGASPAGQTVANPTLSNLDGSATGMSYDVTLTVTYTASYTDSGGTHVNNGSLALTKKDSFRVITVPSELQLGRAYRRGFPETYGWDDIVKAYNAVAASNDNYVYFHHLENAFFNQQNTLLSSPNDPAQRQTMSEIVNELQQGQTMVANQALITALRIKYPRLTSDVNPSDATSRMNPPAGTRTETAAIDGALLDYSLAVQYSAAAIRDYGTDILRSKAPVGAEPFPDFPLYLSFYDPTLSHDAAIPIKNEYWQLSTAFERMELGRVEKAKKLWRLSSQDATALPEAKAESKTAGTQAYLAMALLAAGQSASDYQANEGNFLLAHVKNARDLFNNINAGVNPLGNDGSFIPNESFAAIYQAANEAVAEARADQIQARQETRTYQQYQADLRTELQNQRASFITPLYNLSGLDPALYNNLQTVDDRNDYRATIATKVQALLHDYPNASAAGLGEFGNQVIAILDAGEAIVQADNRLKNLAATIAISAEANTQIKLINQNANITLRANDIARGYANSVSTSISAGTSSGTSESLGASFGFDGVFAVTGVTISAGISQGTSAGTSTNTSLGSITSGYLNADDRDTQVLQQAQIADVQLEAQTRRDLLDEANLVLDIRRAKNAYDQQRLRLDQMISQMDRYIEDLAHARDTAAPLYFQDPTFQVVVSTALQRAENQLDYTIDKLYRLAKTLQYEWTEPYQNPVIVPANSGEPASLENALFDKFTNIDSLFFIRTSDEAYDYIGALKAWNSKLRRINGVSVRGPNHSGPLTAVPISLRENILGLKPDTTRGYTLDNSIRDFRNYLATKRVDNYFNVSNPSLALDFQTEIDDNAFFPATGAQWNMRINSITIDIYAESGFSDQQVATPELIQSGTVSLRRFFANPPYADDVSRMRFYVDNPNRSAFLVTIPAKINGANGGRPPGEFINMGLADRPIAATDWILRINTEDPTNRNIDFSKIKDIVLTFTYTYGNPPEFAGF